MYKRQDQKLIFECNPPTSNKTGGRPAKYYRATGKTKKEQFSLVPRNSVYKVDNPDTGTDLNNNEDCKKDEIVKSPDNSKNTLYKENLSTKPIVNEILSAGTDGPLYTDPRGYIEDCEKFWGIDEIKKVSNKEITEIMMDDVEGKNKLIDL